MGRDRVGGGGAGWLHAQVFPDVELVLRGHGAGFGIADDGDGDRAPGNVFAGDPLANGAFIGGGAVGIRGRYRAFPTLMLGGEALIDYLINTGTGEHFISGLVALPVAEQAAENFWVYTDVTLGIAIPLHEGDSRPFFGIQEAPLGVVWRATDWLLVVAEGGYALPPINGGYGAVAVSFRL